MTMTDAEIVRHYQEAANKTKDIKVLAELNLCAPADIRAILAALPPDMPEATRREAGNLLLGLFADYLAIRLGEAEHGA